MSIILFIIERINFFLCRKSNKFFTAKSIDYSKGWSFITRDFTARDSIVSANDVKRPMAPFCTLQSTSECTLEKSQGYNRINGNLRSPLAYESES